MVSLVEDNAWALTCHVVGATVPDEIGGRFMINIKNAYLVAWGSHIKLPTDATTKLHGDAWYIAGNARHIATHLEMGGAKIKKNRLPSPERGELLLNNSPIANASSETDAAWWVGTHGDKVLLIAGQNAWWSCFTRKTLSWLDLTATKYCSHTCDSLAYFRPNLILLCWVARTLGHQEQSIARVTKRSFIFYPIVPFDHIWIYLACKFQYPFLLSSPQCLTRVLQHLLSRTKWNKVAIIILR